MYTGYHIYMIEKILFIMHGNGGKNTFITKSPKMHPKNNVHMRGKSGMENKVGRLLTLYIPSPGGDATDTTPIPLQT